MNLTATAKISEGKTATVYTAKTLSLAPVWPQAAGWSRLLFLILHASPHPSCAHFLCSPFNSVSADGCLEFWLYFLLVMNVGGSGVKEPSLQSPALSLVFRPLTH